MNQQSRSISARLNRARVMIDNTMKTPAVRQALARYGYPSEQLQAGMALYDAASAAAGARTVAAGAQAGARRRMQATEKAAAAAYQKISEIARAIYHDSQDRLVALGLDMPMPRTTDAFLTAAFRLFNNAAAATALAEFGYSLENLAAERAKIDAYQTAVNEYRQAIGAAQLATQHRNAALASLYRWTGQYGRIARAVLKDEGELLKKIGLQ